MKSPRYQARRQYGINMTPMIDVVFLLIIFFLVSSHLTRQESQIELALPIAKSGADDVDFETPRVTVNVQADGGILIAGRPVAVDKLSEMFQQLRGQEGDDLEVRIRGSRQAPYSSVEPIMLACTRVGIWNVSYAVYREDVR